MHLPFRRRRPLHERLAEQAEVPLGRPPPVDTGPRWGEVGIHGVHRQRQWDAFATAEAPALTGSRHDFVALPDGTLLVDDEVPDGSLGPLADALEAELRPPYRAQAARQDATVWAVTARRIEVVPLEPDMEGDEFELAVAAGERSLLVDGRPAFADLAAIERLAGNRFRDFVVRGARLEESLWEISVAPL